MLTAYRRRLALRQASKGSHPIAPRSRPANGGVEIAGNGLALQALSAILELAGRCARWHVFRVESVFE